MLSPMYLESFSKKIFVSSSVKGLIFWLKYQATGANSKSKRNGFSRVFVFFENVVVG